MVWALAKQGVLAGVVMAIAVVFAASPAGAQEPVAPTTPPTRGPGDEPPFNFEVVKEVVAPLVGDDGTTHYVTLSEDSAGALRIRLSLFHWRERVNEVFLFPRGVCPQSREFQIGDVIIGTFAFELEELGSELVLVFRNTVGISILPGPMSIYDEDGASLAMFSARRTLTACAVLAGPPAAPESGNGAIVPRAGAGGWSRSSTILPAGLCIGSLLLLLGLRGVHTPRD